ncbi:MAG: monovalent cation/H(+) antiporter subunit G [Halanaerobiales bacterium]|nr:monovalent cation/H(+) antiporter subunit G [Halanaerobiales bacterium]
MSYLIYFLTISGLFFFIVGTIGILRMPDVLSRVHAAAKCDTLGAGLIILAILLSKGLNSGTIKLLLIIIFLWITTPTAASAISSAHVYKKCQVEGMENIDEGETVHD